MGSQIKLRKTGTTSERSLFSDLIAENTKNQKKLNEVNTNLQRQDGQAARKANNLLNT